MSKDVQSAIALLKELRLTLDQTAQTDLGTIASIHNEIIQYESTRDKTIQAATAKLKSQQKLLESAKTSSTRPASVPSAEAHSRKIELLHAKRISAGKAITDAEEYIGAKEAELAALIEETRALEDFDAAGEHAKQLDGTPLRIEIYKGLGFEAILEPTEKILIRSHTGDIHCVTFEDDKSDVENANLLWDAVIS